MNIEEAIKINKEIIEYLKKYEKVLNKKYSEAIGTLLSYYEKEKNKELEIQIEELKKYKKYYEEMEEVNKKFIAVDKIKAKIEEYENYGTSIYYGLRSNGKAFHQAVRMEVKEVLQSLLDKE